MEKRRVAAWILVSISALLFACAGHSPSPRKAVQAPSNAEVMVEEIIITGKIEKSFQGYAIQGEVPEKVFRVINPDSEILDQFAASGLTVYIEARHILGNGVEIYKINGRNL